MNWILTSDTFTPRMSGMVGGKTGRLARLGEMGYTVPFWIGVTADAYNTFLDHNGLRERIALELHRKVFEEMRWEEIWDCALRIRSMFQAEALPDDLRSALSEAVETRFGGSCVAVRSSATDEDTHQASFAGLHASYINICGTDTILTHMVKVWTSLWSDAALLYRKEVGLNIGQSAMAVLVQGLVKGKCSGVVFTRHPTKPDHMVIEAVYGLNQGMVDGTIEPDRWVIKRSSLNIISHAPAQRTAQITPATRGVRKVELQPDMQNTAPLDDDQIRSIAEMALNVEDIFGTAQDIEWTYDDDRLVILQARDITTQSGGGEDQRGWYLSLHRSFDQLMALRQSIEKEHIPAMIETAEKLSRMDLTALAPHQLSDELERRWKLNQHWSAIYWSDFIPYAHGVRLFGQFYNDAVKPEDPYEFMDLLTHTNMQSLKRNAMLQELSAMLAKDPGLGQTLSPNLDTNPFEKALDHFIDLFGDLSTRVTGRRSCRGDVTPLIRLLKEMGSKPSPKSPPEDAPKTKDRQKAFLDRFSGQTRNRAEAMLDLARSSHQLRDDDNIYLGRIESMFLTAVDEARRRLPEITASKEKEVLVNILNEKAPKQATAPQRKEVPSQSRFQFRQRQLVGQPAGPGLTKGIARVITDDDQLTQFKSDEILVCDAVDPNMTFVVPLAAGIVERRGGMLIHGAIIAREYGLPCITGVPQVTALIRTGDTITVDGYLGIVTLH